MKPKLQAEALRALADSLHKAGDAFSEMAAQCAAPDVMTAGPVLVAFPFGLERAAARRLIQNKVLTVQKFGRHRYTTSAELMALMATASAPSGATAPANGNDTATTPDALFDSVVAKTKRARRRAA